MRFVWLIVAMLMAVAVAAPALADDPPVPLAANGLAQTPPMGWNSWNKFGCDNSEATVRATADAMAASGMRDAGYRYLVIDDCWQGKRDKDGFIQADASKFPSGIKALADYVHGKGLKFGIYSDAGEQTCGHRPGSQGHEYQDALQYARWGVDYLKYDWCSAGTRNAEEAYRTMALALRATGRPIVFSICEWGTSKPWLWATNTGNLWRATGDIWDHWQGPNANGYSLGVMDIADLDAPLWPFAGPGHWNDADMLEVGNGGMTDDEYRAHFSLWAMLASSLMAGNDVAHMTPAVRSILLNKAVIAVDQDALGEQGRRIEDSGDQEVWMKPLSGGARAVLFLNRGAAPATIGVKWRALGYPDRLPATVTDLWSNQVNRGVAGAIERQVAPHAVVMVRIDP
ncbi:glycoside hydrolase family 27 protein [Sphingomonas koreensis]|nr:glycoside hydrolase family 27 protein [Sphingomonas koreensis]